jgi:ABC-type transport system involved in cytochrome bd biosynthesis fused ATPase/permease subunit
MFKPFRELLILVFDAGKIVQEGNFKSLSETKGLFQDFLQQKSKLTMPVSITP